MTRVHTEGTLPHEGIFDQSMEAQKDWAAILNLAMAWNLTGEKRYLEGSRKYLDAWLTIYKPGLNPIDETKMDQMLIAYDLLNADLPSTTREMMNGFLREMAEGYLRRAEWSNDCENWQSHRIKLATLASYSTGDIGLVSRSRDAFRKQLMANINPDGSVADFRTRDALHYVVYDLEPLLVSALAAKAHGEDWFHASSGGNRSIESALDWLTPYASGAKSHQEFVHSKVFFDAKRAKAGIKGYSGQWDPYGSSYLFQLAATADSKYLPLSNEIFQKAGKNRIPWIEIFLSAEKSPK